MDEQKKETVIAEETTPEPETTEGEETFEDVTDEGNESESESEPEPKETKEESGGETDEDDEDAKYRKLIAEGKIDNVIGEIKRLKQKSDKVQTETKPETKRQSGQEPEYIKELREMCKEEGLPKLADKIINAIGRGTNDILSTNMGDMQVDYSERKLAKNIDKLGEKPEYKSVVKLYRADLEKAMKTYPDRYWKDEELIEAELGKIVVRNMGKLSKPTGTKTIAPKISETHTAARGSTKSSGVATSAIEAYADAAGWDSKIPETRNKIIKILKIQQGIKEKFKNG